MSMATSYRPRDGGVAGTLAETTEQELATALHRAAHAAPAVAAVAPSERRAWLCAVAERLAEHEDELVEIADQETALGIERLTAELARAAGQLSFYGSVAAEGSYLDVTIDEATDRTPWLARVNQPLGPVVVFGASNFPFAFGVLGNDTAASLAAGCPVLVKAHPAHLLLSVRLAELAKQALHDSGAPRGAFELVVGQDAGLRLVGAEELAAVAFTGSQAGGMALWRLANERRRPIPVYAEMGTVNPVVVTPGGATDMAATARGFVASFTLGCGQFCTKPGILFAPAGHDTPRLVGDALAAAAPEPIMLTKAIAESATQGLTALQAAGAGLVRQMPAPRSGWAAPAAVLRAPLTAVRSGSRLLEECFGPLAIVVEYQTIDDVLGAIDQLQGALAGSVFTGEPPDPDVRILVEALSRSVGRVIVNDWPTGVACTWAQHHGGPWPATSNPAATSVGAAALRRFVRPVAYQSAPEDCLPSAAQPTNPWRLPRRINGTLSAAPETP